MIRRLLLLLALSSLVASTTRKRSTEVEATRQARGIVPRSWWNNQMFATLMTVVGEWVAGWFVAWMQGSFWTNVPIALGGNPDYAPYESPFDKMVVPVFVG